MARSPVIASEGTAVLAALARYRGFVVPQVRRELAGWREAAALIPDPVLRERAMDALTGKAGNAEAAAVLSILAPRRSRLRPRQQKGAGDAAGPGADAGLCDAGAVPRGRGGL